MGISVKNLLVPSVIVIVVIIVFFVIRNVFFKLLHRWAQRTETNMGNLIIVTCKTPSIFWCIASGLYIGLEILAIPSKYVFYLNRAIYVIVAFSITIATANLLIKIFENYVRKSDIPVPTAGIVHGVLKAIVFGIGILGIFNVLGVSIAPFITALGVGGLAVALVLKDTLSNLFSGLHIIASGQIKPGNYIKIQTGEEGYVTDISWRSTTIKALSNNMVIVPNDKLASTIITNYSLPDNEIAVPVHIGASYRSDLARVERVTLEVAKKIMEQVQGGVPGHEPTLRYHTFGESSIGFTITLRAREFADQYLLKHEFIKMLFKKYSEEGVEMPFPIDRLPAARKDGQTLGHGKKGDRLPGI